MRFLLTGRHVEVTPAVRRLVDTKLAKLGRMLNDSLVSAQVVVWRERYRHIVEISVHARGDHILHGLGDTAAWDTSLTEAVEKISHQAKKLKGKWQERKRHATPAKIVAVEAPASGRQGRRGAEPEDGRPMIVRPSRYAVKPMTIEEAALAIEDAREAFVVFRNATTDAVNVVYRRKDGNLGLIEPDA
ncbi:MAG: ribosome-associated translation inhibitor RaiA [Acidobacteria bacterium]|nr:ribosome-associated translation inhibitor RaiA [Acidobacteriota bacterium]